jgi:hypothetical protein
MHTYLAVHQNSLTLVSRALSYVHSVVSYVMHKTVQGRFCESNKIPSPTGRVAKHGTMYSEVIREDTMCTFVLSP